MEVDKISTVRRCAAPRLSPHQDNCGTLKWGYSGCMDTYTHRSEGVHLWLVLLKAYAALKAHAECHIRSLGIGFSDFAVLEALLHKGPLPVNTIGSMVRLTSGSITAA